MPPQNSQCRSPTWEQERFTSATDREQEIVMADSVNLTKRLPRGAIPSPRYELAAAHPHIPDPEIEVPPSFMMWPVQMSS